MKKYSVYSHPESDSYWIGEDDIKYSEPFQVEVSGLTSKEARVILMKKNKGKGGNDEMKNFETSYSENLPSPNYKTRHFTRTIRESFPDDIEREDVQKAWDRQGQICETLVKNDIARHIEELSKE